VDLILNRSAFFALGTRTLADLIAPGGCAINADHLRLDGQVARVLIVAGYPRLMTPGWLSLLVETDLPIEASLHVQPLPSAAMVRPLGVQIARLQSSRRAALRGERVADPQREIALKDAERLRERLQWGEERLFAVSLYLLVRARTLKVLEELTGRVEEQLDALLGQSRRALWEQDRSFRGCLPELRRIHARPLLTKRGFVADPELSAWASNVMRGRVEDRRSAMQPFCPLTSTQTVSAAIRR
jgi:hypothetical protein